MVGWRLLQVPAEEAISHQHGRTYQRLGRRITTFELWFVDPGQVTALQSGLEWEARAKPGAPLLPNAPRL